MPESILQIADKLINGDRREAYGHPYDDYSRVTKAFNSLTGHNLSASDGPIFMICVKLARETHQQKKDNRIDGAGYFGVLDMVREKEEELTKPKDNPHQDPQYVCPMCVKCNLRLAKSSSVFQMCGECESSLISDLQSGPQSKPILFGTTCKPNPTS